MIENSFTTGFGLGGLSPVCNMPWSSGSVYWDGSLRKYKIIDGNGNSTVVPTTHSIVQLDDRTKAVLDWAAKKMQEEAKLNDLCEKHPGLKETRERFEIMLALVKQDETNVVIS